MCTGPRRKPIVIREGRLSSQKRVQRALNGEEARKQRRQSEHPWKTYDLQWQKGIFVETEYCNFCM